MRNIMVMQKLHHLDGGRGLYSPRVTDAETYLQKLHKGMQDLARTRERWIVIPAKKGHDDQELIVAIGKRKYI